MHWNEKEIIEKYNYINNLYTKEKKPLVKRMLYNDLCTMGIMKSLYDQTPFEVDEKEIIDNHKIKDLSFLSKCFSDIILPLNNYVTIRIHNRKPFNTPIDNYEKLLMDFFKNCHPQLESVFNKLIDENKIELNTNKKFESVYSGECLFVESIDEFFVYSRYNNKMFTSHYLPHELGHAYQAIGCHNIKEIMDKRHSLFVEVYSTYVELIYIDYLKRMGYTSQAIYLEKNYWKSFIEMIERQFMFLLNEYQFFSNMNLKYIMSILLSNIFYEDYLINNNHDMITDFNNSFIKDSDKEIIKEYKLERIMNSGMNAFKRIL